MTLEWERLKDGTTYKVYKDNDWFLPYTVASPEGKVLTCTTTLRGALRFIERKKKEARQGKKDLPFWERELVIEVEP